MPDDNQVEGDPNGFEALDRREIERSESEGLPASPFPRTPSLAYPHGLALWLTALALLGVGGLLLGEQEMAALVAFAGIVIAAQAADFNPRWTVLYWMVGWVVPVGGCAAFASMAWAVLASDITGAARVVLAGISVGAALLSLLTLLRPVSNELVAVMFGGNPPSHAFRLAARVVLIGLLFAVPGYFAFPHIANQIAGPSEGLLEHVSMGGELVGYVVIALAAVGFMVRRDLGHTLERLGIRPLTRSHLGLIAAGLAAVFLFNNGADWIQHRLFPALWTHDHDINERLAKGLGVGKVLMLGLSAGVGEEITLRGALQPRLGLVLTSILFASLHVQYSWFGMLAVMVLGLILGTIRIRAGTSASIAVHALYDILAVFTT